MRIFIYCFLLIGTSVLAAKKEKRQASYTFPGPRSDAAPRSRQASAPVYQPQGASAYADGQEDAEVYQVPRRQFQAQPVQYVSTQNRAAPAPQPAPQPAPVYEPSHAAGPAPRQSYSAPASQPRKKASASSRANKYGSAPQQSLNGAAEEQEDVPDPLSLLLEDSSFTCSGKSDGYYADDSVNCQVFHYCVGGAKHSWMCPDGTLFHQVHLNCVNEGQDICAQSQKFHFVNDYLYKPIDYEGPNNTARYSQRYYPDGYVVGDPILAPESHASRRPAAQPAPAYRPQVVNYPPPASAAPPAPRPQTRQVAPAPPPPPSYSSQSHSQSQSSGYGPSSGSRSQSRPARPSQSYSAEVPQGYRSGAVSSSAAAAPQAPPQSSYQSAQQDELYQQVPRRQATPQRSSAGYTPPRQQQQQQRPTSSRSAAPVYYPNYASNQAAGVQYDEDY